MAKRTGICRKLPKHNSACVLCSKGNQQYFTGTRKLSTHNGKLTFQSACIAKSRNLKSDIPESSVPSLTLVLSVFTNVKEKFTKCGVFFIDDYESTRIYIIKTIQFIDF